MMKENAILLVVDMQERLIPSVQGGSDIVYNAGVLAEAASIIGCPVIVTEQEKLGDTTEEIKERLGEDVPIMGKKEFSCLQNKEIREALQAYGKNSVVLCGIEAHICILQTALELLEEDYIVYVISDAVSSHDPLDLEVALERLVSSGANITTTESWVYELLGSSEHPKFREILRLIKEKRSRRSTL